MENALPGHKLRTTTSNPPGVSVYDVLREITGSSNPRRQWTHLVQVHSEMAGWAVPHKFPGRGQQDTPVASLAHARVIARRALSVVRLPLETKRKRMEMFGCDMTDADLEMTKVPEAETIGPLAHMFRAYKPVQQFAIGSYRLDLYLTSIRVAVECDEHGHRQYDQVAELARQSFVEAQLGCVFVKFDPFAADFSLHEVAARIIDQIVRDNAVK